MQSKVYLALVETGQANSKQVAQIADMDRANVHRALEQLMELELVTKEIGYPNTYTPFALQDVVQILVKKKEKEVNKIVHQLKQLSNKNVASNNSNSAKGYEYFKILPAGFQTFNREWEKALYSIKHGIDLIVSENREVSDGRIFEIYEDILKKGISARWIVDRSKRNDKEFNLRVRQFQHLLHFPTLRFRYSYDSLKPWGFLVDNEFVVICFTDKPPIKNNRTFWTNNKQILLGFKKHFETTWKKSINYTPVIT